ncbi:MAG: AraC family transcriptional regulator ligand-binding domain-containing protein [Sphingomonas paucimobilis]
MDWWRIPPAIWASFRHLAVDPARIAQQAGLSDAVYLDRSHTIPTRSAFAIWRSIEASAGNPTFGLEMMGTVGFHIHEPIFLAANHAPTFRDALDAIRRFERLYTPLELRFVERDGLFHISRHWLTTDDPEPSLSVDFGFARLIGHGRRGTRHAINAVRLDLRRRGPRLEAMEEFFGCNVRYGANSDALILRTEDVDRAFHTSETDLYEVIANGIIGAIAERTATSSIDERVKAVIGNAVRAGGRMDLDQIAAELAMSSRTLQRRIEASGISFRELQADSRHEFAREMIAGQVELKRVASRLGYADIQSFYRAFKRREGVSPALWRSRQ